MATARHEILVGAGVKPAPVRADEVFNVPSPCGVERGGFEIRPDEIHRETY